MLGGGTFITQNKVLNGTYINFVSAARASATLSDRGVVALPIALNWGKDGEVFSVTAEDFQKNSMKIFGYDYTAPEMMPFREIFKNAIKIHVYNLNTGGVKATSVLATAKYAGTRGNSLKYVVSANIDESSKYDVVLYMDGVKVDSQTVSSAEQLVDNDYVFYKTEASLEATTGTYLTGGTNGDSLTGSNYQTALDKLESYNFNVLVCPSDEASIISLFVAYTKRLRDQVGVKFQTIVYKTASDYEGVISLENAVEGDEEFALVYWLAGAEAGCAVNKSCTNKVYDGELVVDTDHTQSELEAGVLAGKLMFHNVEGEVRLLTDINTFVSFTSEKNEDFGSNQVIRVIDQCANDTATIFNTKYLGKIQNDKSGRVSLWSDIVAHRRQLQTIRAIENYDTDSLVVEQGESKNAVVVNEALKPTVAMEKLYMTIVVE